MRSVSRSIFAPWVLLAVLLTSLLPLQARALRCPGGVVDVGDHKIEVLDACGEPISKDEIIEAPSRIVQIEGRPVTQTLGVGFVVEEWVYEFSPQRFRQLLRFRNNRLLEVRTLDKPGR